MNLHRHNFNDFHTGTAVGQKEVAEWFQADQRSARIPYRRIPSHFEPRPVFNVINTCELNLTDQVCHSRYGSGDVTEAVMTERVILGRQQHCRVRLLHNQHIARLHWPARLTWQPVIPSLDTNDLVQFSPSSSAVFRGKVIEMLQPEKMSLEPSSKLTATDGRGAKVKWQWVPDRRSCDEEAPPVWNSLPLHLQLVLLVRGTAQRCVQRVHCLLHSQQNTRRDLFNVVTDRQTDRQLLAQWLNSVWPVNFREKQNIKIVTTRGQILRMQTNSVSAGALPQTQLGSLQRSPDRLAAFKGSTKFKGEGDREGKIRGRAGRNCGVLFWVI